MSFLNWPVELLELVHLQREAPYETVIYFSYDFGFMRRATIIGGCESYRFFGVVIGRSVVLHFVVLQRNSFDVFGLLYTSFNHSSCQLDNFNDAHSDAGPQLVKADGRW